MDVSIIVATYNSEISKLRRTLSSILCQKDIHFEIIIADDGSLKHHQEELNDLIKKINKDNIITLYNKRNEGTIKNLLKAVKNAQGEYVFTIGPGDLIFDPYVLHDLYFMARQNDKCNIFFGNAVYYSYKNNKMNLYKGKVGKPRCPELYCDGKSIKEKKIAFFFGNYIIGASYLRRRETAVKYFELASKVGIYAEDMLSTSMALAENEDLIFLNRNTVWYEYGTGISTNSETKWVDVLYAEYIRLLDYLTDKYPQDRVFKAAAFSHRNGHFKRILYRLLLCPDQFLIEVKQKRCLDHKMEYSNSDKEYLESLLFDYNF